MRCRYPSGVHSPSGAYCCTTTLSMATMIIDSQPPWTSSRGPVSCRGEEDCSNLAAVDAVNTDRVSAGRRACFGVISRRVVRSFRRSRSFRSRVRAPFSSTQNRRSERYRRSVRSDVTFGRLTHGGRMSVTRGLCQTHCSPVASNRAGTLALDCASAKHISGRRGVRRAAGAQPRGEDPCLWRFTRRWWRRG